MTSINMPLCRVFISRFFLTLLLFSMSSPAHAYWGGGFSLIAGGHIVPSGITATIECKNIKDVANMDLTATNWTSCTLMSFAPGSANYGLYYMTINGTGKTAPYTPTSASYLPGIGCPTGQVAVYDYSQPTGCKPVNTSPSPTYLGPPCPTCGDNGSNPGPGTSSLQGTEMSGAGASVGASPGKSGSGYAKSGGSFITKSPVEPQTGNAFYSETDYESGGSHKLGFARFFNSTAGYGNAVSLGIGWRHTYDRYITGANNSGGTIERADGRQIKFAVCSSGCQLYIPDADQDYKISRAVVGGNMVYTLVMPDDSVEIYSGPNTSTITVAQLQSITYRDGYTLTLTRAANTLTVTDSYSRVLTLNYDSYGNLISVGTPDSTMISYGYESDYYTAGFVSPAVLAKRLKQVTYPDAPLNPVTYAYYGTITYLSSEPVYVADAGGNCISGFQLASVTDQNGNVSNAWTYDQFGRVLTAKTHNGTNLTTISYNDSTGTRTITQPTGEVDTYTYTTTAGYPRISRIDRAAFGSSPTVQRIVGYDGWGWLYYDTDWYQTSTPVAQIQQYVYTNNARGLPTQINDGWNTPALKRTTNITYTTATAPSPYPSGYTYHTPATMSEVATASVAAPRTWAYTYDTKGNLLTKTAHDASGQAQPDRTWTYTYDSTGQVLTAQDPKLNTTTFTYTNGSLATVTDALSHVTTFSNFTGGGRPQTVVDTNGTTYGITYDARQRITSTSITVGGVVRTTNYAWRPNGELLSTTYPDSTSLTRDYAYEVAGASPLTFSTTDAAGNKTVMTLNNALQPLAVKTQDSASNISLWRNRTYDGIGRLATDTNYNGSKVNTYAYDNNLNVLTATDGNSHTTTYTYDALNHRKTMVDANSGTTTINYDALDNITSLVAPGSITTSYIYDGFSDTMREVSPDRGTINYTYDKNANLTSKTDAASIVANYTYDALNRLATVAYPSDTSLNVTNTYDQSGHGQGIGKLTSVSDAAGTLSLSYDERGMVTARNRTSSSGNMNLGLSYNSAGRLASITYPSSGVMGYTRDTAGNIATVTYTPSGGSATTVANFASGYLPFGPAKAVTLGNGVITSYTYDHDINLLTLTDNSSLQNLTYAYDNANNVSSVTDAISAANTQTFGYDVIDRLTSATSGSGGYGTLGYAYNANGNRTSHTINGVVTNYTTTASTNKVSAIGSQNVSYNSNGNISTMITGGTTNYSFTYNAANKLATATTPSSSGTFTYEASGLRFKKVVGGTTTLYQYGSNGEILEENAGGTRTDTIYANGIPIASANGSAISYIHTDRLGAPQLVTNGAKAAVWQTTYDPYGKTGTITGGLTQNLRLPGQNLDAETGLYLNGFRFYMPGIGGYPMSDPIGLAGGANPYGYVGGNPTGFVDPMGLFRFGFRPLKNLPYIPLPTNTGWCSCHEQGFSDDGKNIGYFGSGIGPEVPNMNKYTMYGPYYNDDTMHQAAENLRDSGLWDSNDYVDFGSGHHNCQDFAKALREEYKKLGGTTCSRPFSGGQCSAPSTEHYDPPPNDPYHHGNPNFGK